MAKLSKTKLFEHLVTLGWEAPSLDHDKIGNETYGRNSRIYLSTSTPEDRTKLENDLEDLGHSINRGYWKGSSVVDVGVTFFKGYHWDE